MTIVIILIFFWADVIRTAEQIRKAMRDKKIDRAKM